VVDSGQFVLGAEVERLEEEMAAYLGVSQTVAVSSGSDALLCILWAEGVGAGDEIITPSFAFVAPAEAIVRLGARPVFADVGEDLNIDPGDARTCRGERTQGVLAVDLFGRRAQYSELGDLPLFEDAAQSIGVEGVGKSVRAAALSFFPTKNLGALGDGGLVATDDDALAGACRELRAHGAKKKYFHTRIGWNMRLDALQAAVLRIKLPHVRAWNAARAKIAARYLEGLAGIPGVDLPSPAPSGAHVWHQFVVGVDHRDALRASLASRGIETEVYYPVALHELPCFGHVGRPLLRSERAARRALALPIHPMLDEPEVSRVIAGVRELVADAAKSRSP
jgi:dTDP-4-amino-4,6-dideoxygalactose transaminase